MRKLKLKNKYQEALDSLSNIVLDNGSDGYDNPKFVGDFYYSEVECLQELINKTQNNPYDAIKDKSFKKIFNLYENIAKKSDDENILYCLYEMMDGSTFPWYEQVARIAKLKGISKVYDIGANVGIQRYFFEKLGISYIPVDNLNIGNINNSLDGLIEKSYPFDIDTRGNEMIISHLCIGYLIEFKDCIKNLKQFNNIVLDLQIPSDTNILSDYNEIIYLNQNIGRVFVYSKKNQVY